MRFRANRLPYFFPAWVDEPSDDGGPPMARAGMLAVKTLDELRGTVIWQDDRAVHVRLDPEYDHGCAGLTIEWLKECMEVIEP